MSLYYRLFGLACVFCGQLVERLDVYEVGVRAVHEPGYGPPCNFLHNYQLRAGGAVEFSSPPASPASLARSMRGAA